MTGRQRRRLVMAPHNCLIRERFFTCPGLVSALICRFPVPTSLPQARLQPGGNIIDLLQADLVGHGITFVFRSITHVFERRLRLLAATLGHHGVVLTVKNMDRQLPVGGVRGKALVLGEVGGQGHQARQGFVVAERGMIGDGAALGKARHYDSLAGDAPITLAIDQGGGGLDRTLELLLVDFSVHVEGQDVIPGGHDETTIDGNRYIGRVRKNKPDCQVLGQAQRRHDGFEIMARGAQAMEPDDRRVGVAFKGARGLIIAGFDFDTGQ